LAGDKTIADRSYFENGFFNAHDVRVHSYWNFLSGAAGYTYGNNAIWQMFEEGGVFNIPCLQGWKEAMDNEGSHDMKHLKEIFTMRPFEKLVSKQNLLIGANPDDRAHVRVAAASDNSFLMAYSSVGQAITLNLEQMGEELNYWWFNPANGDIQKGESFTNPGEKKFVPSDAGSGKDWLLVVDDLMN
jgi:hypothetical protein